MVESRKFLTFPEEQLVVATRKHWFALVLPLTILAFLVGIFTLLSLLVSMYLLGSLVLFITSMLVLLPATVSLATKIITDWYYHVYIVTSRKILEVCSSPFFSDTTYEVLLDQVRIIEIDVKVGNILDELLDMGSIVIAFDRPSHEERFVLQNVKNPREIGMLLCDVFEEIMHDMPVWFRRERQHTTLRIAEDVFPESTHVLNA